MPVDALIDVVLCQHLSLKLHHEIPSRLLPLSSHFVTLAALCRLWLPDDEATYSADFRELLKLLEYVLI